VGGSVQGPVTNEPVPAFSTRPPLAPDDARSYSERYGTSAASPAAATSTTPRLTDRLPQLPLLGGALLVLVAVVAVIAVAAGVLRPFDGGSSAGVVPVKPGPTALPTPTPTPAPTGLVPDEAEIAFCLAAYEVQRVTNEWRHLFERSIVASPADQPGIRTEISLLENGLAEIRPVIASAATWEPAGPWSGLLTAAVDRLASSLRLLRTGLLAGDSAAIRAADAEVLLAVEAYGTASAEGARLVLQYPELSCQPR
jgi:hypothetical protein